MDFYILHLILVQIHIFPHIKMGLYYIFPHLGAGKMRLFYRDGFGQVAGLVYVLAFADGHMIGQQL